jgi:TetR/AcrR family transcriptional regulator, cholesterol catabolism regulator
VAVPDVIFDLAVVYVIRVNDCLPQGESRRQSTRPTLDDDAAVFEMCFAESSDLTELTWAARRLLAMSAALFYRQGAAATSIRDIARACKLTPGALYKHFASKDDLLHTIVSHGHVAMDERIEAELDIAGDGATDQLSAFVRAYVLGHLMQPQLAQVVRREYLHLSEQRYQAIVQHRRRTREHLGRLLATGQREGTFDLVGPTPTSVALMILDMCSQTSVWYDPSRTQEPDVVAERYVRAALRLAGCRP